MDEPPKRASAPPPPPVPSALRPAPAAAAAPAAIRLAHAATPAGAPISQLDDLMPTALQDQLKSLETWARGNHRDSRWDAFRFWALKIPAIVVSAGSGVTAYYGLRGWAVIAGAVASLCVLIDALNPGGALRNSHLRAFNDLRILQDRMKSQWQVGLLRNEDQGSLAAKIIEGATKEKERINEAITIAETSLGATPRRGKN